MIYRKPELRLNNEPEFLVWNKTQDLIKFIEMNYHMDVDIYTHDSKYLYDLHSDDIGMIYFAGAKSLYHQQFNSPVSKLIHVLHEVHTKLKEKEAEFVTEESKQRFQKFALALTFKSDFWYLSQRLNMKMEMDFAEEFTPIVLDHKQKLYIDPELKYLTMETLNVTKIVQFYYGYIQGTVREYYESEPLEESYMIDGHLLRRLNQTEASSALATVPGRVGTFILAFARPHFAAFRD